ncbi:ABC transporter substrate-binding protein [Serinibacter salmoneus]|uniref:Carbohydrate ABC transporter substrate-binding protein (CUT1 family) n=1 Tax=Serinibacter salmoneus TaxID=556530 RepID=A0A2A9D376_9MICO|nr:extracellular solute-binding protein [Serinibacter salmoneus]PFG20796.1 carbohydrate ABC transporter substrate-binding protein (CUT1 family) [Serinibacter salmoneus]
MNPRRYRSLVAVAAIGALGLTACGSGEIAGRESDGSLLVWSLEVQPDRVAATEAVIAEYTAATGIEVELVPVQEDQVSQLMSAAALSGELPDVVGSVSLGLVRSFALDDYLNGDAAAEVIENLDASTWNASALELTQDDGEQLSVPSDAWAQILAYRTDVFEEAGLAAPDTYEALLTAAQELTGDGNYGISLATDASNPFTQQTFEALALGNDCQMVNDAGEATLDSPECTAAIELYAQLSQDFSPSGTQTVESTRASYFSGQAAMTIWSTFLLDEMAGLRDDAAPSCEECTESDYLAQNTGIVPLITGPDADGNASAYGEMTSWVITSSAPQEDAVGFVEFMLSDGYAGWFGMAPEGKFPVRNGTAENPTEYVDTWTTLPAGVDTKLPLAEVYSAETIDQITSTASNIGRWALPQGQGELLGPLTAELPFAKALADLSTGSIDVATAQQQMQDAVAEAASN